MAFPKSISHDYDKDIIKREFVSHGGLFAIKQEGDTIGLYIDDDGIYYLQTTFNQHWIKDLRYVIKDL